VDSPREKPAAMNRPGKNLGLGGNIKPKLSKVHSLSREKERRGKSTTIGKAKGYITRRGETGGQSWKKRMFESSPRFKKKGGDKS